jgi:prophage antirepressor-like protein
MPNIMKLLDDGIIIFQNIVISVILDNSKRFWFCANDIASALGYKYSYSSVRNHVNEEDMKQIKDINPNTEIRGQTSKLYLNFSGACSLILRSKLPKGDELRKWFIESILPAIHDYHTYCTHREHIKKITDVSNKINYLKDLRNELTELLTKNHYPNGAIVCAWNNDGFVIFMSDNPKYMKKAEERRRLIDDDIEVYKKTFHPEKLYVGIKAALYGVKRKNDKFICKISTLKRVFEKAQLYETTYSINDEIGSLEDERKKLQNYIDSISGILSKYFDT